ncbi:MAG: hypothetical protein N2249_06620 [Melioribacter sp.]|nr:hypothetical protein [Melioribacter sp.]
MRTLLSTNNNFVYFVLFIISATVISFEIISTRISSVIFVYNYAFIILSLAILGLACGGIYTFYKLKNVEKSNFYIVIFKVLIYYVISLASFSIFIVVFSITNHIVFFILLFIPFFLAGILYTLFFKSFSENIFKLYAADLGGAALGAFIPLVFLKFFGAVNSILILASFVFSASFLIRFYLYEKKNAKLLLVPIVILFILFINGKNEFLGPVPIGNFPEKDFYYVYSDVNTNAEIIDSRWSIYGRADLVKYSHQDMVRQLFIDGAAGTQMYKFNGNIKNPDRLLIKLLLGHSTSIPFIFLNDRQKDSVLIIGPGGGKEVLLALLSGIRQIFGVEINPDFVDIVKKQSNFNGGIYTKFPNVKIFVKEGRHFVKQSKSKFDILVIALPSTEQLQNIDAFAMSENYLLTSEALSDYLNILTNEGMLVFTLHNKWELLRLIITTLKSFEKFGVKPKYAVNHFVILEDEYAPTIVIKKSPFSVQDIDRWKKEIEKIPEVFPQVTYMPGMSKIKKSFINDFLLTISEGKIDLNRFVENYPLDISPATDNKPFFYKISKLLPSELKWLLIAVLLSNAVIIFIAKSLFKREKSVVKIKSLQKFVWLFIMTGVGFMILEITLFQKLILYVGSPTISLSVLLFSLLIGMGIGSMLREKIISSLSYHKLSLVCLIIIFYGIVIFFFSSFIFKYILSAEQYLIIAMVVVMIIPLGMLLGTLFPSFISLLKENKLDNYIPWMYGINASSSVLGSVLSYSLSMLIGFALTFIFGLLIYFLLAVLIGLSD